MSYCTGCRKQKDDFVRVRRSQYVRGDMTRRVCIDCAAKVPAKAICNTCGSMPWRVVAPRCRKCGLVYAHEEAAPLWPKGRSAIADMEES